MEGGVGMSLSNRASQVTNGGQGCWGDGGPCVSICTTEFLKAFSNCSPVSSAHSVLLMRLVKA